MSNEKHVTTKKKKSHTKSKISSKPKKPLCTVSSSSSRKSRTKTRRPKFLSLQKQIIKTQTDQIITRTRCKATAINSETETMEESHHHLQLNLFPLHPDNITSIDDDNNNYNNRSNTNNVDPMHACDDVQEDNNMAMFLLNNETTATLNGLLSNDSEATAKGRPSGDDESDLLTPSSMSTYKVDVRSAMKRSSSGSCSDEEKWVWYTHDDREHGGHNNLPEAKKSRNKKKKKKRKNNKKVEEEVTSTCGSGFVESYKVGFLLKLENYEEILNAWSDKGSVLIDHGSVNHDHGNNGDDQTVPDLNFLSQISNPAASAKNLMDGWGGNGSVWRVPEKGENEMMSRLEDIKDVIEKTRQREASVLRYKEKRQNRLFAKRIRYEVRKVNAEKRPRIKGRFVRRNSEEQLP